MARLETGLGINKEITKLEILLYSWACSFKVRSRHTSSTTPHHSRSRDKGDCSLLCKGRINNHFVHLDCPVTLRMTSTHSRSPCTCTRLRRLGRARAARSIELPTCACGDELIYLDPAAGKLVILRSSPDNTVTQQLIRSLSPREGESMAERERKGESTVLLSPRESGTK